MRSSISEIIVISVLMLVLGLIFTYPLIMHFNTAIPFAHFSDNNIPFLKPGDHFQIYYWLWILKDNIFGHSPLFSNPYEFNMLGGETLKGYYMFPLSLIFLILTPLGEVFAYNSLIILSFILAGLFMYLLVKLYTGNKTAAFFSAIIFSLAPFRVSQLTGHLNGFIFFLLPLIIYLFEGAIKKESLFYSFLCGVSILSLALMEFHLTYYLFIFLSVYIPFRFLMVLLDKGEREPPFSPVPSWFSRQNCLYLFILTGGGITIVLFSQMVILHHTWKAYFGSPFFMVLAPYTLIFVFSGLFLSSLFSLFTGLKTDEAFAIDRLSYLPIFFLLLYPVQFVYNIPHLGKIIVIFVILSVIVLKVFFFFKYKRDNISLLMANLKKNLFILLTIIFFIVLSAGYIFYVKIAVFSGSIAKGGRGLREISLYSPGIVDIFQRVNPNMERHVYLGIIPVILAFFVFSSIIYRVFKKDVSVKELVFPLFFSMTFIVSYMLSLGLAFGKMSLYILFYNYFPFFNFPRSPGRMMAISFFTLSILAGYSIKGLQERFGQAKREKLFAVFSIMLVLGITIDYYSFRPMGITALTGENRIYRYVKENIGNNLLLEIPLWPGDSHQSSLYEYYITLDQVKRVNGYNPVVSRKYVETIFKPLASLNLGQIDEDAYNLLDRLKVKFLTVHDNPEVFPPKVSPYPPLFTVRRFMKSPYLNFIMNEGTIYLFKVKERNAILSRTEVNLSWTSVISNIYDVERLRKNTGTVVHDKEIESKAVFGNVKEDKMGHLTYGPYVNYPKGKYLAYFRLKTGDNSIKEPVVRIEVSSPFHEKEVIFSEMDIRGVDFREGNKYSDFYLYFDLPQWERLEFRTFFYKKADIWVERVVVSFVDQKDPAPFFEAERLLGNTGKVIEDPLASQGMAILGNVGEHERDYLIYGPYRKYPPGRYQVHYIMKINGTDSRIKKDGYNDIAEIDVTSGSDSHILASKSLNSSDFKTGSYQRETLNINLDRENELSFGVKFGGNVNILVDKVEINQLIR